MTTHTVDSLWELVESYCYDIADSTQVKSALREAMRQEYNRGVTEVARVLAPKYAAPLSVGKTHSGSIMSCGCSTYTDSDGVTTSMKCTMHAVLALKEPTP
jgi:hypothetical protein